MKKIYQFLFLCQILASTNLCAQAKFPAGKYSDNTSLSDYVEACKERTRVVGMGLYYSQMGLLNPVFGEGIKTQSLRQTWGAAANFRFRIAPLFIDAEGQLHNYRSEILAQNFIHLGSEISLSSVVLPIHYKSLAVLQPYLGAGYHYGVLVSSGGSNGSQAQIESPFFKTGLMLNIHENFYVDASYRQSMFGDPTREWNGFNAGIGLRGKALGQFWKWTAITTGIVVGVLLSTQKK